MRRVCTGPERGCRERVGCEETCAAASVQLDTCGAIFNSVSKSEAELNMVFVIRCGAGGSGNGVQAVGVGSRASACALAVIRQPASPHWQAWGLGGSNLGRSFGERRIASSHRDGGQCAGRGVCKGRCEAVAPCDLSRSLAPHHSPPTAWFKGRCGVKGGHSVGCDPGARCTWGARWVEGG